MKTHGYIGSVLRLSCACALLSAFVIPAVRGSASPPKQFLASCTITHLKDGKTVLFSSPKLCILNGQQGSFLIGGELMTGMGSDETIKVGEELNITVRDAGDGNIRISAMLSESQPAKQDGAGIVVHESSARTVQPAKLGEPVILTMENGSVVRIVLSEVKPGSAMQK